MLRPHGPEPRAGSAGDQMQQLVVSVEREKAPLLTRATRGMRMVLGR